MRESLIRFVEREIIPRYDGFDKGHQRDHVLAVIEQGQYLAGFYDVDREVIYAACACHDLGLRDGREQHHIASGKIIREELDLSPWFSAEQVETIARAAEDHRASSDHEPRDIYGKIVAEADRQIIPETVIRRTIQFGLKHYPELDKEGHWERTVEHLEEKYAEGGYLKLWIPESPNAARLEELRAIIRDRDRLRLIFDEIYDMNKRITFNTIALFTRENKPIVDFYTKVFGFTTDWDGVQPNVEMRLDGMRILLFPRREFEKMVSRSFTYPEGVNGTMEISFDVPAYADVDREFRHAVDMGAEPILEPTTEPWGQRTCYVADPDGNLIEISSFTE